VTELPHSKGCFVCGAHNRIGLKLRFRTDGKMVETDFIPGAEHNGFVNVTHGGILATLLDEIMVWACGVETRNFAYCAEMNVRYLSPSRPGESIRARGELVENKRGRLFLARGELLGQAGQTIATSTGKYLPVKDVPFASLLEDFEGTKEQLQNFFGRERI
jgi:uncharacterized protein (TIGR00369 family)